MKREQFGSRLGFILVSAGCAIGLGNVWKFPYMAGKYGGAAFILVYLLFLVILGLPIIVCEFSVGRASQKKYCHILQCTGTAAHQVALRQMGSHCRKLSSGHVLFYGRRLDALLLLSHGKRRICLSDSF